MTCPHQPCSAPVDSWPWLLLWGHSSHFWSSSFLAAFHFPQYYSLFQGALLCVYIYVWSWSFSGFLGSWHRTPKTPGLFCYSGVPYTWVQVNEMTALSPSIATGSGPAARGTNHVTRGLELSTPPRPLRPGDWVQLPVAKDLINHVYIIERSQKTLNGRAWRASRLV